jgi:hypothetical protein
MVGDPGVTSEIQIIAAAANLKRAYPTDAKGNIDEWAAVFQKQADIEKL